MPAVQIIAPAKAAEPAPAPPAKQVAQASTVVAAETGPPKMMATLSVAVRAQPAKASRQIGGLEQGQVATVTSTKNGWMLVTTSTGVSGWVYGRYLEAVSPQIAADSPFWTE
jgi:uncharacterized protein YgiM (DUF1202 family)